LTLLVLHYRHQQALALPAEATGWDNTLVLRNFALELLVKANMILVFAGGMHEQAWRCI